MWRPRFDVAFITNKFLVITQGGGISGIHSLSRQHSTVYKCYTHTILALTTYRQDIGESLNTIAIAF